MYVVPDRQTDSFCFHVTRKSVLLVHMSEYVLNLGREAVTNAFTLERSI